MRIKDIKVRDLTDDDMLEVTSWYVDRRWAYPPNPDILPQTAYVAELDGKLLAVIWLYVTNSRLGILDWVATSPKSGHRGIVAVKKIVDYIEELATVDGQGTLNTLIHFTHNDKLASYFNKKCGFKDNDKVNTNVKVLKPAMSMAVGG
jgi:hypothetical protein